MPKLHNLCKLELYICLNVNTKAKKTQKNEQSCLYSILVRDIRGIELIEIETTQSVFTIFAFVFSVISSLNILLPHSDSFTSFITVLASTTAAIILTILFTPYTIMIL